MPADPLTCPTKALHIDRQNQVRGYFVVVVPVGHDVDDISHPTYFGFHSGKLAVGDVIEVNAEDMSWYGEWLVRAIPEGLNQVHTAVRFVTRFEASDLPEGWDIKYLGGEAKHTIFRGDLAIKGGFATHQEAALKVQALADKEGPAPTAAQPITERKKSGPKPKPPGESPPPPAE